MARCSTENRHCAFLTDTLKDEPEEGKEALKDTLEALCKDGQAMCTEAELSICGLETAFKHDDETLIVGACEQEGELYA